MQKYPFDLKTFLDFFERFAHKIIQFTNYLLKMKLKYINVNTDKRNVAYCGFRGCCFAMLHNLIVLATSLCFYWTK